jgi:ribosomal 50S subunit-recycling heat shock protein
MRIDIFLRLTGLLKTRSLAGKACRGGFVLLNGGTARASSTVSTGDVIDLTRPDGSTLRAEVLAVPGSARVSRKERENYVRVTHTGSRFTC